MTCLDLEMSLDCAGCGANVPVNAFVSDITCWSCERHAPLDGTVWRLLLEEPLREAAALVAGVQKNATLRTDIGTFHRVIRAADPICGDCKSPIPADHARTMLATDGGRHAHCPRCSHPFSLRAAPAGLASLGTIALAGESEDQLRGARAHRAPVPLACTSCGGGLHVDGSTRVVKCPFCSSDQYLPAELFASLRSMPVRIWSLVLAGAPAGALAGAHGGAAAAAPAPVAHADWTMIMDAVVDAQGNMVAWGMPRIDYAAAADAAAAAAAKAAAKADAKAAMRKALMEGLAHGGGIGAMMMPGSAVWSMGPDGMHRWRREGLAFDAVTARLAITPSGHVIMWDSSHAEVMQLTDGATVFKYSGEPGEGGRLETRGARSLTVDADGSIVIIGQDGHFLRATMQGQPIAMWGMGPREPLRKADDAWVHELGNKPPLVHRHAALGAAWDGHLHVGSTILMSDTVHVATFDRSGKHLSTTKVPTKAPLIEHRVIVDAGGTQYVIVGENIGSGVERTVFRVDGRTRTAVPWLLPRSQRGLLGSEHIFCVAPNGTIFALGNEGSLRRFGPDGRVQHVSKSSANFDEANR